MLSTTTFLKPTTLVYLSLLLLLSPSLAVARAHHSANHHLSPRLSFPSSSSSAPSLVKRLSASSLGLDFDVPDCDGCQEAVDLASSCVESTGASSSSPSLTTCFCTLPLFTSLQTCLSCQASLDPSILDVAQKETDKLGSTCDAVGIFLPHIVLTLSPSNTTTTSSSSSSSSSSRCSPSSTTSSSPTSSSSSTLPSSSSTFSLLFTATSSSAITLEASATPSSLVEGAVSSASRRIRTAFFASSSRSQFGFGFGAVALGLMTLLL